MPLCKNAQANRVDVRGVQHESDGTNAVTFVHDKDHEMPTEAGATRACAANGYCSGSGNSRKFAWNGQMGACAHGVQEHSRQRAALGRSWERRRESRRLPVHRVRAVNRCRR